MIFRIINIAFKTNQFRKDPNNFLEDEAKGFLNGLVFMPMIIPFLFLLFFFFLGYTEFLSGPYGFFKFLFWILFIPFIIIFIFLFKAIKMIRKNTKKVINDTIHIKAEIKE